MADMATTRNGCAPILTAAVAGRLLAAMDGGEPALAVSLDLGLSTERVPIHDGVVDARGTMVQRALLANIARREQQCFEVAAGDARPIAVFSEVTGWVRTLLPTADAPTTLVAGFPMHRLAGTTPLADARAKVRALRTARGRVLDTATGLGYTAIELARAGCDVVTVELDPAAIDLARRNPWSAALFECAKVRLRQGDVVEIAASFASGSFSAVLHDPPTRQLAGELYSAAFYAELRRILKPGGRLFHYVGDPDSRAGARVTAGVMRRLADAGFDNIRRRKDAFGIVAVARSWRLQRSRAASRRAPLNNSRG